MKSFGCLTLKDKLRKGSEVLSQGPLEVVNLNQGKVISLELCMRMGRRLRHLTFNKRNDHP